MKKEVVGVVVFLLVCSFVMGAPSVITSGEVWGQCHLEPGAYKEFRASETIIDLGVVCSDNALVDLFECVDAFCREKVFVEQVVKSNGVLPSMTGFDLGRKYAYECRSCSESRCPVLIEQGKEVASWSNPVLEGMWGAQSMEPGIHEHSGVIFDGDWERIEFCSEVVLIPPTLNVVEVVEVAEGDIVMIEASCVDEDGKGLEVSYSGWMDESTKQIGYAHAGEHEVVVSCVNSLGAWSEEVVTVVVEDRNRAPVILGVSNR